MCQVLIAEAGNFDIFPLIQFKKVIRTDREKSCNFYKHFNRRKNIIIFPVGYGLFGYMKLAGQLYLADIVGNSQGFYDITEHREPP